MCRGQKRDSKGWEEKAKTIRGFYGIFFFGGTKIKVFSGKKQHVKYNLTLSSFVTANVQVVFAVKYLLLFILFSFYIFFDLFEQEICVFCAVLAENAK